MPDPLENGPLPADPVDAPVADAAVDLFYDRALTRIRGFMAVLGAAATVVTTILFGWKIGVGVFLGCVLAWVNLVWLKQAINTIGEMASHGGRAPSAKAAVAKSVLRYALIGIVAYVIFLVSRQSLYGFLGGLFLAVAAILCEAAYEFFVALRRGF
jgi:hypothetical protein